jgi:hypothetical protein
MNLANQNRSRCSRGKARSWKPQLHEIARSQRVDRGRHGGNMRPDPWPTGCWQDQDRELPASKVLLVMQVLVRCNKGVKGSFGPIEKVSVFNLVPAHSVGRGYRVTGQFVSQRCKRSLVEKDSHPRRRSDRRQTLLRVVKHDFNLLSSHARKPSEEILHTRAILEVLEERLYGDPRPFEHPSTTDFSWCSLNGRTLTPIKHGRNLTHSGLCRKASHCVLYLRTKTS